MAKWCPRYQFQILGVKVDTNPGPFSVKEHALIGIFGTTGAAGIYGTDNLVVQEIFYDVHLGPFWGPLFLLSTQLLGFGLSGICRKFLVRPAHMIWPSVLPSVALFSAFHMSSQEQKERMTSSKGKRHRSMLSAFTIAVLGMSLFTFVGPGYIAPGLSYLPLLCWLSPTKNRLLQELGSPKWGPGILSLTLDWTALSSASMTAPYWSSINMSIGLILFTWVFSPWAWKSNWFSNPSLKAIKFNDSALMDKSGNRLVAAGIVDPKTRALDQSKYEAKKPIFLSPQFAFSYFTSMAGFSSAISHVGCWYGRDIWYRFRAAREDHEDIHCKLIDVYDEVPNTWYYGFFVITGVLSSSACYFSGIYMPIWATFLALGTAFVGTVPIAVVLATSGVQLYMNVISQFVIGMVYPGYPLVSMAFKSLTFLVSSQCLNLLSDLKLGHYLKVPPRHVFIAQISSQIMAVFVCFWSMSWWLSSPEHVKWVKARGDASVAGPTGALWGATNYNIFYSASLIWGAIGPKRFFFESVYGTFAAITLVSAKFSEHQLGSYS
jgi:OPT family small oligopeptide transporter